MLHVLDHRYTKSLFKQPASLVLFLLHIKGQEDDDLRLMTDAEEGRSIEINNLGAYPTCCIQLSLDGLAVNTVLQSQHINDYEGASGSSISFDCVPQVCVCVCVCV